MTGGSLWPSATQMLVLRAALGDGQPAIDAFERWCAETDFDGPVDPSSARLLPLVHANMARLGSNHPRMGLIRGLRRRTWVETQKRLRDAAEALERLAGAGIPAMVAKGIALTLDYYERPGLRPMIDIDLLVGPDRAIAAIAVLQEAGWTSATPELLADPAYLVAARSAVAMVGRGGIELDLHWHLLPESTTADSRHRFWRGAVPIRIGAVAALRPGPTEMLLHVMIHGMRQDVATPLRWIPDSMMILRKDAERIDWRSLIAFARQARLLVRVGAALQFLHREFDADIPPYVVAEARRARPTLVERLEHAKIIGRGDGRPGRPAQSGYLLAKAIRMAQSDQRDLLPGVAWRWLVRRIGTPGAAL